MHQSKTNIDVFNKISIDTCFNVVQSSIEKGNTRCSTEAGAHDSKPQDQDKICADIDELGAGYAVWIMRVPEVIHKAVYKTWHVIVNAMSWKTDVVNKLYQLADVIEYELNIMCDGDDVHEIVG